jgi:hypothetical protein
MWLSQDGKSLGANWLDMQKIFKHHSKSQGENSSAIKRHVSIKLLLANASN